MHSAIPPTQGFSGRYTHVEVHEFLIAGQIDSDDVEAEDTSAMTLRPGERTTVAKGHARVVAHRIGPGSSADHSSLRNHRHAGLSLEFKSVRLSAIGFTRLATRRFRP